MGPDIEPEITLSPSMSTVLAFHTRSWAPPLLLLGFVLDQMYKTSSMPPTIKSAH